MNSEQRDYFFAVLESELRQGLQPAAALIEATSQTALVYDIGPERCEHGVRDGAWCEPCNRAYKEAARLAGDE